MRAKDGGKKPCSEKDKTRYRLYQYRQKQETMKLFQTGCEYWETDNLYTTEKGLRIVKKIKKMGFDLESLIEIFGVETVRGFKWKHKIKERLERYLWNERKKKRKSIA